MTAVWIAAIALSAPPAASTYSPSAEEEKSPFRLAQELRDDVSEALRREATTEGFANEAAILELVALYGRVMTDTYLTKDERLRLRALVRARLLRIEKRLKREIRLAEAEAERAAAIARREGREPALIDPAATTEKPPGFHEFLGQQLNAVGQAIGQGGGAQHAGDALIELIKTTIRPDSWDDRGGPGAIRLFRTNSLMDGVQQAGQVALQKVQRALGGGIEDDGEELVELIQTVIAPQSWDVNGGPGSIYYFRPLHVLVIRQTGEIHGHVGGALGQLRAAGN